MSTDIEKIRAQLANVKKMLEEEKNSGSKDEGYKDRVRMLEELAIDLEARIAESEK